MDLSFIPNMNKDVENIIFQFKLDLEYVDKHKKQMKKIFDEMIKKLQCIKCKTNIKEYHIFNKNIPSKYIRSPLCGSCFYSLTWISALDILELFDIREGLPTTG